MNFKLQATMIRVLWASDARDSFLNSLQETIIDYRTSQPRTKTWTVWSKLELSVGSSYDMEGYITESPDSKFTNEAGKVAYKCNFNATKVEDISDFPADTGPGDVLPIYDDSESIPF